MSARVVQHPFSLNCSSQYFYVINLMLYLCSIFFSRQVAKEKNSSLNSNQRNQTLWNIPKSDAVTVCSLLYKIYLLAGLCRLVKDNTNDSNNDSRNLMFSYCILNMYVLVIQFLFPNDNERPGWVSDSKDSLQKRIKANVHVQLLFALLSLIFVFVFYTFLHKTFNVRHHF